MWPSLAKTDLRDNYPDISHFLHSYKYEAAAMKSASTVRSTLAEIAVVVEDSYRRALIADYNRKRASVLKEVERAYGQDDQRALRKIEADVNGFVFGREQPVKYSAKEKIALQKEMLCFFTKAGERTQKELSENRRAFCEEHEAALKAYGEGKL